MATCVPASTPALAQQHAMFWQVAKDVHSRILPVQALPSLPLGACSVQEFVATLVRQRDMFRQLFEQLSGRQGGSAAGAPATAAAPAANVHAATGGGTTQPTAQVPYTCTVARIIMPGREAACGSFASVLVAPCAKGVSQSYKM